MTPLSMATMCFTSSTRRVYARLGVLLSVLLGVMTSSVSAETLLMPKRDMLMSPVSEVVWGVTTLPNHTGASPTTYTIQFGDGSPNATGNVTDRSYIAVNHAFIGAGTFTVTLLVTNGGTTETATTTVRVFDPGAESAERIRGVNINRAIENGLRWLWTAQVSRAANFPNGVTTYWGEHTYSYAALVTLAFENHGYHLPNDDSAPTGLYEKYIVRRGLNFVIDQLQQLTLTAQPAGDPCVNVADGPAPCVGLRQAFESEGYATSIAILPLAASNALNRHVSEITGVQNSGFVVGKTYGEILQRLVNAMSWGQGESGVGRGGWHYSFNSGGTDGSTIGWNVLALLDAAASGITVPSFVKSEFVGFAIPYGLNMHTAGPNNVDGSFDYAANNNPDVNGGLGGPNMAKSGIGLQAMFYADMVGLGDAGVTRARNAISNRWDSAPGEPYPCFSNGTHNKGCGYAMFNVFKALKLQGITTLPGVTRAAGPGAIPAGDWYADYVDWLLTNQTSPTSTAGGYWAGISFSCCASYHTAGGAALAELILSPVALIAPDPTLFSTVGLSPATALLAPGGSHTVTATATSAGGAAVAGATVNFQVLTGPNAGAAGQGITNPSGQAAFTYPDAGGPGRDTIQAFIGNLGSNVVEALWQVPECSVTAVSAVLSAPIYPIDQGWRGVSINGAAGATVTQVCQDEAPNFEGIAAWAVDAQGVGSSSASIRAQRSGTRTAPGNGRVYHVYFTSNSCTGKVTVGVPTVAGGTAVDGGPLFNSVTGAACAVPATPPTVVTAPNVVGSTQAVASASILAASLGVGRISQLNHPTIPAGSVISQLPAGGTSVALGSAVALTVSSGPSSVAVPNVVGQPQVSATNSVSGVGLVVSLTSVNDPAIAAGLVIAQAPIGGTQVPPGSGVSLTVSLGPAVSIVPNVVGLPLAGAVSTVGGAGLNFGTVNLVYSATVPDGKVISQTPAGGTAVTPGSVVNFDLSLGPLPIAVANVIGQTEGAAAASIVAGGHVVGTVLHVNHGTVPAGQVFLQAPPGGALATPGASVNYTVSDGPVMVPAPTVVGFANVPAQTAIVGAGLVVGTLAHSFDEVVPFGSVISQTPAGGASVPFGSPVNLTLSKGPAPVTVPNLVGQQQAAATASLVAASLAVGTINQTNSATVPLGTVMGQSPAAGTPVPHGTAVNLLVSAGPVMAVVPNVVGASKDPAMAAVLAATLSVRVTYAASATVPVHTIISQTPAAGTSIPQGSFVDLVASSGPTIGVVPNLIGQSEANATTALTGASLVVGAVTHVNHPTVPAGDVISQNPGPGSTVPVGSSVNLIVSLGPVMVTVPSVVGDVSSVATAKVLGATLGYALTYVPDPVVPVNSIISQNPAGGTSVAQGTMVNLVASSGPTAAVVPNVVGQLRAAAESAIIAAGLVVGPVTQSTHDTVPVGAVISQSPDAGLNAPPGSAVSLVVSTGPAVPATVPNVVAQPRADAEQAITAAGFVVGAVTQVNDATVPLGDVISQTPAGGSSALTGSAVDLVVSLGSFIPGVPNSLELQMSSLVLSAGSPATVTAAVADGFGTAVTPTPPITYEILTFTNSGGALPTLVGDQLSTGADTRGSYTLRGTVDGTSIVTDRTFVVLESGATQKNAIKLVKLATAEAAIAKAVGDLHRAYETVGTAADVTAARNALTGALLTVPITGKASVRKSTVLAPEYGFLPSLGEVTAAGYPLTPADTAFGNLITQINAKVKQVTTFYNNLNPDATVGSADSVAELNTLNSQLDALLTQLGNVHPTPHAVVRYASQIHTLMSHTIPLHLHAATNRLISVSLQYPNPGLVPGGIARMKGATEFFAGLTDAPPVITPGAFYGQTRPAFFFLISMFGGSSIQMQMIQKLYGEVMHEVDQMLGVLLAHEILSQFIGTGVGDLRSGGSLSFHAPGLGGSAIEGFGFGTSADDNETWFIGPEAFQAVEDLASKVKGAFESLQGSIEECLDNAAMGLAVFCDTDSVSDFFDQIEGAIQGAQEAYDRAHTQPSEVHFGCVLDDSSSCQSLVYGSGFPDVNTTRFPSPVIVLHRNWVSGGWGLGIFNFVP